MNPAMEVTEDDLRKFREWLNKHTPEELDRITKDKAYRDTMALVEEMRTLPKETLEMRFTG